MVSEYSFCFRRRIAAVATVVFSAFAVAFALAAPWGTYQPIERLFFDFPAVDVLATAAAIVALIGVSLISVRYLAGEPSRPQRFLERVRQSMAHAAGTPALLRAFAR